MRLKKHEKNMKKNMKKHEKKNCFCSLFGGPRLLKSLRKRIVLDFVIGHTVILITGDRHKSTSLSSKKKIIENDQFVEVHCMADITDVKVRHFLWFIGLFICKSWKNQRLTKDKCHFVAWFYLQPFL